MAESRDVADRLRVKVVAALDGPGLPLVAVEWQQIAHVFSNLITNAVSHSPAGGEV